MKQILPIKGSVACWITTMLLLAATATNAQQHLRNPAYNFLPPALSSIRPGSHTVTDAPQQFSTNLKKLTATDTTTVDGNITVLGSNFSNGMDPADVLKINNPGENLALVRNNSLLVIESRKPVVSRDTIFYSMYNMQPGNYQLEFVGINMTTPGLSAILVDRFLSITTPVALNLSATVYNFSVTSNPGSFAADRFIVVLVQTTPAPLPVNFVRVQASRNGTTTQVQWTVSAELHIRNYTLERSADGRQFEPVGTQQASTGNALQKIYSLTDLQNFATPVFYRIRANELDGTFKYSAIVRVNASTKATYFNAYPNPVKGSQINLAMENQPAGVYDAVLTNIVGAQITQLRWQHAGGTALQGIQVPANLPKGLYQLNVFAASKSVATLQLLID